MEELTPPPVRRLSPSSAPEIQPVPAPAEAFGAPTAASASASAFGGAIASQNPSPLAIERMSIDSFSVAYGDKTAVNRVSLPVRQGEVLALIGPSGCGKTTLLRSLNRLIDITPTASTGGEIRIDGIPISEIDPTALRRLVTMVFQQPNPFPMSIFDNIAYVLREQAKKRPRKAELIGAVEDALTRVGSTLDHPALRLSGGQQQRLCIARAIAARPEVLLLDEPCSALDPRSTETIEQLILKLREEVAVVIVTHNLQQAHRIADYVAFMYLGELVEYGPARQVFSAPKQERTAEYLQGAFG